MFRLIKLLACLHAASRDVFFRPRSEVEPRTPGQLRRRTAVWVRAVLAVARRTRAHPVAGLRPARAAPRHDARSDRRRLWPAVARSRRLRSAPAPLRPMLRICYAAGAGPKRVQIVPYTARWVRTRLQCLSRLSGMSLCDFPSTKERRNGTRLPRRLRPENRTMPIRLTFLDHL